MTGKIFFINIVMLSAKKDLFAGHAVGPSGFTSPLHFIAFVAAITVIHHRVIRPKKIITAAAGPTATHVFTHSPAASRNLRASSMPSSHSGMFSISHRDSRASFCIGIDPSVSSSTF
jgi:hypothetical protein